MMRFAGVVLLLAVLTSSTSASSWYETLTPDDRTKLALLGSWWRAYAVAQQCAEAEVAFTPEVLSSITSHISDLNDESGLSRDTLEGAWESYTDGAVARTEQECFDTLHWFAVIMPVGTIRPDRPFPF